MNTGFVAIEKFGPRHDGWKAYIEWSGLAQLRELISLDTMLCSPVIRDWKEEYWSRTIHQDSGLIIFIDLDYLQSLTNSERDVRIVGVERNPGKQPPLSIWSGVFQLAGFDLLDADSGVSALNNCGGFPDCFANTELSDIGLIASYDRALEIQARLRSKHPEEPHANCELWGIYLRQES